LGRHQYRLMELLLVHPLLSSAQLGAFLGVQEVSVKQYLFAMRSLCCLETEQLVADPAMPRWRLSSHGLRLLALRHHIPLRTIAVQDKGQAHPYPVYTQKGIDQLRRNATQTIGVYTFFTRLATGAVQHPGHRLLWWETGYAREQAYYVHSLPAWTWEKPHGIGEYQVGAQRVRFWLEWHVHWNALQHLRQTLEGYASSIRSTEWRREGYVLPLLLLVCPDGGREWQIQQIIRETLGTLRPLPLVLTTTVEMLNVHDPLAPIWNLVSFTGRDRSTLRRTLYDMRVAEDILLDKVYANPE
ncbi:MAG: hypothetical protein J2P37_36585, partial [Ktedonobacteraceae bacterium]|nr:hypothetical protein [Ktedonobacteraceae bacterium]